MTNQFVRIPAIRGGLPTRDLTPSASSLIVEPSTASRAIHYMNQLGKLVISFPKTTIALTIATTVILSAVIGWRGIGFDGSPQTLTRNDEALRFYNEVRASFGDDRVIVVALTTGDVFSPEFIQKLGRLTARLE